MHLTNTFPDSLLIEGRDSDIQLEKIASTDLLQNLGDYLEPNFRARRMAKAYDSYVDAGGETNTEEYLNMRAAYSETFGKSNKVFSDVIARHARQRDHDMRNSMFQSYIEKPNSSGTTLPSTLNNNDDFEASYADAWSRIVQGGARSLEVKGWWKSKVLAPQHLIDGLKTKVLSGLVDQLGDDVENAFEGRKGAPMQIKLGSADASAIDEMYELSADPLLLSIVQRYLGVQPIFNTPVAFLNSFGPASDKQLSDTAQLYHHDMHRLGFVKVFIYLTDVDENAGPHTLVQKTHRKRPVDLWEDGRHSDEKIMDAGLSEDEVHITGPAGTVFLVDTSCLHKGSHPSTTSRLMAQVQYVNSLFGKPTAKSDHKVEMALRNSKAPNVEKVADLVRKYSTRVGTRFVQNFI